MVRTRPTRAASRGDRNCDNEEAKLETKKNAPAALSDNWKRRNSHNASSDCTTKPPPNESRLNSAESRSTAERDASSGCRGARATGAAAVCAYSHATNPPTAL